MSDEVSFDINGYCIAAQHWNPGAAVKVIALHGWLDNSASFDLLSPLLVDCEIIALDLAGHGKSDHKAEYASYNLWDDLSDILACADELGWQQFHLLGHSRGAMMAFILAASLPDRVSSVVLIDGIIPEPIRSQDAPTQLGRYLTAQTEVKNKASKEFATIEDAVTARLVSTIMPMEKQAIEKIVKRGLRQTDQGFIWSSDPRLRLPSSMKLNADHCHAFASSLKVKNLLILASAGLGQRKELQAFINKYPAINGLEIEGGHHLHMEEQAPLLAKTIAEFYQQ